MSTTFYSENVKHCMFWVWSVPIMLILRSAAEVGFDTAESTPSRIWVTIDSPTNFPPPQPATPDPRPLGSKRVYVQLCFKINQHWPKWSPSLTKSSHATGQMEFQHINAKTIFLSLHEQSENVSSLGHILQFKLDLASSQTNRHMRFDSWLISQWPPWESCRLAARWIRAALCRTRPILRSNTGGACFKWDLKLLKITY